MTFKPKTFSEIFTDMRERTGPAITDFETGSVARTMYESFAYEMALLYEKMNHVYLSAFIDTAVGAQLDLVVAILDIQRNQPDFAAGVVTFFRDVGNEDIHIPQGTLVATTDTRANPKKSYETIEPMVLVKDQTAVEVKVQAVERGEEQATPAETIMVMPRPIPGIKNVINRDPVRFAGRRREEDDELRLRAKNALIASGKATIFSLENALLSLPGVKDVKVTENFHAARGWVMVDRGEATGPVVIPKGTKLTALAKPYATVETAVLPADAAALEIQVQSLLEGESGQILEPGEVTWQIDGETVKGVIIRPSRPLVLSQFGVVEIFVDSIDFRDPNSPVYEAERARLQTAINQVRAAGILTRLLSADVVYVDAVFRIQMTANVNFSADERAKTEADIQEAILTYMQERKMGQPLLFSQIIKHTLSQPGVDNLEEFTITTHHLRHGLTNAYTSADKKIEIEPFEKFAPRFICVASEEKSLPIHVRFQAANINAEQLKAVKEKLTDYCRDLSIGAPVEQATIESQIESAGVQITGLELRPEPWCERVLFEEKAGQQQVVVTFVERPLLGDVFAYDKHLLITGALKLTLPSRTTAAEKRRVQAEVLAGIKNYIEQLKAEEDIVLADLIALAAQVSPVLNVSLDPGDFRMTLDGVPVHDVRLAKDKIGVQEFERAVIEAFCITGDVERVRVEVTAVHLSTTLTLTVTDPPPPDFDEAALIRQTQETIRQKVKEAINNFLLETAVGDDVIYDDLKTAVQNLVPGINYTIETLQLLATSLGDGRIQELPQIINDQTIASDIHIRSVEIAFMQPLPLQMPAPILLAGNLRGDLASPGLLTAGLHAAFAEQDILLSPNSTLTILQEDQWQIRDPQTRRLYLVHQQGDEWQAEWADPVQVVVNVNKIILPS